MVLFLHFRKLRCYISESREGHPRSPLGPGLQDFSPINFFVPLCLWEVKSNNLISLGVGKLLVNLIFFTVYRFFCISHNDLLLLFINIHNIRADLEQYIAHAFSSILYELFTVALNPNFIKDHPFWMEFRSPCSHKDFSS